MFITMYNSNGHMSITMKGGVNMPGKDKTGPMGKGSRTGRGMGPCGEGNACKGRGRRHANGNGCGRNQFGINPISNETDSLQAEKQLLQARLDTINNMLSDNQ